LKDRAVKEEYVWTVFDLGKEEGKKKEEEGRGKEKNVKDYYNHMTVGSTRGI